MSKGALPTQKRHRHAYSIRITKHWERPSPFVWTPAVMGSPRIWQPENHSTPIEPGPAQFNAFYPQCSGQKRGAHSSIARRSTADRILNIIRKTARSFYRRADLNNTCISVTPRLSLKCAVHYRGALQRFGDVRADVFDSNVTFKFSVAHKACRLLARTA
jgi:hypothetical protein